MNPSYNSGSGSNAGGQPGGIFSRNETGGAGAAGDVPGAGIGGAGNVPSAGGVSGAKPGVIASGPDPADVPAPISIPKVSKESSRSKISAMFGRRGNNDSVISVGPQPMQLTGSSGKPKKGLIIGGLAVVAILIVGLIVGVLMGGGKNGGGGGGNSDTAFNELINYVTSGKESSAKVDKEYDITDGYYFLGGWSTDEEKQAVYDKTKTLMNNFVAKYKDGDNKVLNSLVKSTKEQFDFLYAMNSAEKTYAAETIMTIVKEGGGKAKQKLINRYTFSDLGENSYAKKFLEIYGDFLDTTIANVNIYKENGCLNNNYIDIECMEGKDKNGLQDTDDLYMNAVYYYNLADSFVGNIYYINDLLQGKIDMGEENE